MGKIVKINKYTATVQKYKKNKRKWKETNEVVEWRKNKIKEIKIILNNSNTIKAVEVIKGPTHNKGQPIEHTANENTQQPEKVPAGMWNLWTGPEANDYILQNANSTTILHIASDGTVRDSQKRGNWSWFAFLRKLNGSYEKNGYEAVGTEVLPQQLKHYTEEVHSYRMEALGLLSGLMHLRTVVNWKGTLEWHMDSKSVIDKYKKCHRLTNAEWTSQRDKDVWQAQIGRQPITRISICRILSVRKRRFCTLSSRCSPLISH